MSDNLLDGLTPNVREGAASSDGTFHFPARASDAARQVWLWYDLQGQSALKKNQTYHVGLSVRCASASDHHLRAYVGYMDAVGNKNWVFTPFLSIGTSWGRAEGTLVVPSGMTPFIFGVQVIGACPEAWMANPTLSLGSPVCLASSAHTPYATQDHVSTVYATKASLKVTDDSIKAEVIARAQTDTTVSEISSRLTQTADGLHVSISKLSETLKMGSSTSPVVGIYTNTGLAYKSQSGSTLMELDASRSATISDHMEAQDMKLGKWKWIQTQGGTHLTLVWAG